MPSVSVIVPVYNGRPWLDLQIRSILDQLPSFGSAVELVLADNGSTDGCYEDCRRLASSDGRVRFVDASRRSGNAACRNLGAAGASGDILVFTDQDDICDERWLSRLVSHASESTLAAGGIVYIDHDATSGDSPEGPPAILGTYPFGYLPFAICTNIALPASAFRRLNGFDERYGSACDVDFCWRAQESGLTIRAASDAIVFKRRRALGRNAFSQHLAYARDDALLFREHRRSGMRRQWRLLVRQIGWLLANIPRCLASDEVRRSWLNVAGTRIGNIRGSVEHRAFYP